MLNIARIQILNGFLDARYLVMTALVLIAFVVNGFVYVERYRVEREDYDELVAKVTKDLVAGTSSLQVLVNIPQKMMKPPSSLTFIADGGELILPDTWEVNAFMYRNPENKSRGNDMLPALPALDWAFIIGTLMTLLTVLVSFSTICGEKRDGTLRQLLSNPLSRMKLFLGKYLGLLSILFFTVVLGAVAGLSILVVNETLPLTADVFSSVAVALVFAMLSISFVLLVGIAVSSLVRTPAVALVVLFIGWILAVVAIPGLARLAAEQITDVPADHEIEQQMELAEEAIGNDLPREALSWDGNPFRESVKWRAAYFQRRLTARQRLKDEALTARIGQAELIDVLSFVSPSCLLSNSLQQVCGTGIVGVELSMKAARRYRDQLYDFTEERDRSDPDSPHLLYTYETYSDRGVFSRKPVEVSTVPRSQNLWRSGGFSPDLEFPWVQMLLFLAGNLQAAIIAFIALARYDPR